MIPDGSVLRKTAVILAGGESRRFGENKVWADFRGKPLIETVIERLVASGCEVFLSGSDPRLGELNLPVIPDRAPLEGPLQALQSVWGEVERPYLLLVACDMPLFPSGVIETLWTVGVSSDITVLEGERGVSPLPGVYGRATIPHVESLMAKGRRDLKGLWDTDLKVSIITKELLHTIDPMESSLYNINTVTELAAVQDPALGFLKT